MTIALQSSAGLNICAAPAPCFRHDDATAGVLVGVSSSLWKRCTRLSSSRSVCVRGSLEPFGSASQYHPSEDLDVSVSGSCQDPKLTAHQTARTILQVNSKAILWLPDTIDDYSDEEIEQRPMWPELPYVNDKHGNIYFQVNTDEDFLQKLTSENNLVQAVIGLNTIEMMYYLELSDNNLGIDELEDVQDSDGEDEYVDEDEYDDDDEYEDGDDDEEDKEDEYQDWFSILEGLEDDTSDAPSDWATLESMRKTHPLFFARRLTEAVLDDPDDLMEQQPSGLAIEGLLRPAFIEEHSVIKRHVADLQSSKADKDKIEKVVEDSVVSNGHGDEHGSPEEVENNDIQANGTSFYKLEMTKILLLSPHGHPVSSESCPNCVIYREKQSCTNRVKYPNCPNKWTCCTEIGSDGLDVWAGLYRSVFLYI